MTSVSRRELISKVKTLDTELIEEVSDFIDSRVERLETFPYILEHHVSTIKLYEWNPKSKHFESYLHIKSVAGIINDVIVVPNSYSFYLLDDGIHKFTPKSKNTPRDYEIKTSIVNVSKFEFFDGNNTLFCVGPNRRQIVKIFEDGKVDFMMMDRDISYLLGLENDKFIAIYDTYANLSIHLCENGKKIGTVSFEFITDFNYKLSDNKFATRDEENKKTYIWKCDVDKLGSDNPKGHSDNPKGHSDNPKGHSDNPTPLVRASLKGRNDTRNVYSQIDVLDGEIIDVLTPDSFTFDDTKDEVTYSIYKFSGKSRKYEQLQELTDFDYTYPAISDNFSRINKTLYKLGGKKYNYVQSLTHRYRGMKSSRKDLDKVINILSPMLNISSDLAGVIGKYVEAYIVQ